ncbi:7040_t:CDS:1, partial [Cetraspora pellucida]
KYKSANNRDEALDMRAYKMEEHEEEEETKESNSSKKKEKHSTYL